MKKYLLMFVAVVAMALVSCGNSNKTDATAQACGDSVSVEQFQSQLLDLANKKDTAGITALMGKCNTQIQTYLQKGDTAAATTYAAKIQEVISQNKTTLSTVSPTLVDAVNKAIALPSTVKAAAETAGKNLVDTAKNAAVNAASNAVNEAKKQTVDKANAAANAAVEKANKKANDAVDKASSKATNAVSNAASNAAKKLGL